MGCLQLELKSLNFGVEDFEAFVLFGVVFEVALRVVNQRLHHLQDQRLDVLFMVCEQEVVLNRSELWMLLQIQRLSLVVEDTFSTLLHLLEGLHLFAPEHLGSIVLFS